MLIKDRDIRAYTFSKLQWWKCHFFFSCEQTFPHNLENGVPELWQGLRQNSGRGWVSQSSPSLGDLVTIEVFLHLSRFQPKELSHAGEMKALGREAEVHFPEYCGYSRLSKLACCPEPALCVRWPTSAAAFSWGSSSTDHHARSGPDVVVINDAPFQHIASSFGHSQDNWEAFCSVMVKNN